MIETLPIMTIGIIVITVIVSLYAFKDYSIIEKYKFNIFEILKNKNYLLLFTSGFLHADYGHLFFNMFSFYSFASAIESTPAYGKKYVLLIYYFSMIGGNLLSLLFHKNESHYSAIGASGAVCGIIFASIFMLPGSSIYIFMIPIPIPAYIYAVLYILISIFGIHAQRDNIGHEAHLGGALTGMIIVVILFPMLIMYNLILFLIISVIAVIFIIISLANPHLISRINTYISKHFRK